MAHDKPYQYTGYLKSNLPIILGLLRDGKRPDEVVSELRRVGLTPSTQLTQLVNYIRRRYDIPSVYCKDHNKARAQQMLERYRNEKISLRQLGHEFGGLSTERVRQIICRAERAEVGRKLAASLYEMTDSPEDLPLNALELSVRLANCLKNEGCETVGDAMKLTDQELREIPNFGAASMRELKRCLAAVAREFQDRLLKK
jgi:hypothetical protein